MAKLPRVTQKIFAQNSGTNDVTVFGTAKNGDDAVFTKDISQIMNSEAFSQGWGSATLTDDAPFQEDMNGVQLALSQQLKYLYENGIPEWDSATTYYTNSFCQVSGTVYRSLTDDNTGNNPANDTTNWQTWIPKGSSDVDNRYSNGVMTYDHSDIGFRNYNSKGVNWLNGNGNFDYEANYGLSNWDGRYFGIPVFNPTGAFSINVHIKTPSSFASSTAGNVYDHYFNSFNNDWPENTIVFGTMRLPANDYTTFRLFCRTDNTTGWWELIGGHHLQPNTEYWVRAVFDPSTGYKIEYSLDNQDWVTDATDTTHKQVIANATWSYIGNGAQLNTSVAVGMPNPNTTLYVKDYFITSNGETVWSGNDNDYLLINNGAAISGTANDIISGFSSENYAVLNRTFPTSANITISGAFNVTSIVGTQVIFGIPNYENSISLINGRLALVYNGNTLLGDTIAEINTLYQFNLTWNNGVYTLQLKKADDEEDYTTEVTLTSNISYFGGKTIALGWGGGNYPDYYLKGSIMLYDTSIASEGYVYWSYYFPINTSTVTLNLDSDFDGNFPNGRNSDNTLNNIVQEAHLSNVVVYNPVNGEKAILVNDKNELFLPPQYSYVEKLNPDEDGVLNEIRYSIADNKHYIYKNVELNFINADVVVNNGIVSCFSSDGYFGLPSTYSLGDEFNISLAVTNDADITTKQTLLSSDGINAVVENGNLSVSFRRSDVTKVQRVTTMGTSYQVTSTSTGTTGYVKTAGEASAAVASGLDLYNDVQCTQLIGTTDTTYTYTGSTGSITQTETGYVEFGGVGTVANGTNVYNDANLTDLAGQATGADWVFTDDTAESIICTLSSALTVSASQTIKLSAADGTYSLQIDENTAVTYENTSALISNIKIHIGSDGTTFYKGAVDLNTSEFSMWAWNGISAINPNINIFGNVAVNNGIFSGFNSGGVGFIRANKTIPIGLNTWEIVINFTTTGDVTTNQHINTSDPWGVHWAIWNSKFYIWASSNASSWNLAEIYGGTYTVLPNTTYWVKIGYDGTNTTLSYSLSGDKDYTVDWTAAGNISSITDTINFGANSDYTYPFFGTINMNNTYIKLNGAYIWRWNGLSESASQWQEETLAKIGHVIDDGTYITEVKFDKPITFVTNVWLEENKKQLDREINNITNNLLPNKANLDLSNCSVPYITNTYSNGATGYFRLSTGLYIQWGQIGLIGPNSQMDIYFPISFVYGASTIQATPNGWVGSTNGDKGSLSWVCANWYNNRFTMMNRHEQASVSYSWVAIGY